MYCLPVRPGTHRVGVANRPTSPGRPVLTTLPQPLLGSLLGTEDVFLHLPGRQPRMELDRNRNTIEEDNVGRHPSPPHGKRRHFRVLPYRTPARQDTGLGAWPRSGPGHSVAERGRAEVSQSRVGGHLEHNQNPRERSKADWAHPLPRGFHRNKPAYKPRAGIWE